MFYSAPLNTSRFAEDVTTCPICGSSERCFHVHEFVEYKAEFKDLFQVGSVACLNCIDGENLSFEHETEFGTVMHGNVYLYESCAPSIAPPKWRDYIIEVNQTNAWVLQEIPISKEDLLELSQTPSPQTNQHQIYPIHCNKPMNYLGNSNSLDLSLENIKKLNLTQSEDAIEYLVGTINDGYDEADYYLFQCSSCKTHQLQWDID